MKRKPPFGPQASECRGPEMQGLQLGQVGRKRQVGKEADSEAPDTEIVRREVGDLQQETAGGDDVISLLVHDVDGKTPDVCAHERSVTEKREEELWVAEMHDCVLP